MSASSAEAPQAPGRPSPALTTRPTPLLEGALFVAIRADPRASKPQELPPERCLSKRPYYYSNIEPLCAAPLEALAHSPSQMPLS